MSFSQVPNIVLIMVDDADRKVFEHTPRLRALVADHGATATRYLLNQPLCGPSRASFLRGQFTHNTGVVGNDGAYGMFVTNGGEESNLATWLHGGGYRTALVGKYLNGYPGDAGYPPTWVPPGWDSWFAVMSDAYDSYNFTANDNGTLVSFGKAPSDYLTDVLTRKATEFLGSPLADEPFFLVVTPMAPHGPAVPADPYLLDFADVTYPRGAENPSFNEEDVTDKPFYVALQELLDDGEIQLIDDSFRNKLRCMESIEDMVEAIVDILGDRLDNTYIVVTSDNGFHMGEHRLGHGRFPGGKNTVYEEDIRVPLWVRGPGIKAGTTIDELIGNVDLAPTICALAQVAPGLDVDGRSFEPLIHGESIPWREWFLVERGSKMPFAAVRAADEYVFAQFDTGRVGEVAGEFYDLISDPFELDNGYDSLSVPALSALSNLLLEYRQCVGEGCRRVDSW